MGPFVTSVKKASRDVWMHLPPPVRQAAPYVGAGMGTGILVFNIQQRRLDHAVRAVTMLHSASNSTHWDPTLLAAECQKQGPGAAT